MPTVPTDVLLKRMDRCRVLQCPDGNWRIALIDLDGRLVDSFPAHFPSMAACINEIVAFNATKISDTLSHAEWMRLPLG